MVIKKEIIENNDCFIIMPIADHPDYKNGHFKRVYEDILAPACRSAGYNPVRADDVTQANLIHLDILQKLLESPMAICDLSTRNPNVLFELGLRQAFDKPTVLVQEVGTPKIFDINMFRYTEYRNGLDYRDVLSDQLSIQKVLEETQQAVLDGKSVNSIIKLLSITSPATLQDTNTFSDKDYFSILMSEIHGIKSAISERDKLNQPIKRLIGSNKKVQYRTYHYYIYFEENNSSQALKSFSEILIENFSLNEVRFTSSDSISISSNEEISELAFFELANSSNLKIKQIEELPF